MCLFVGQLLAHLIFHLIFLEKSFLCMLIYAKNIEQLLIPLHFAVSQRSKCVLASDHAGMLISGLEPL